VQHHLESLAEQQEVASSMHSSLAARIHGRCSRAKCPDCGRDAGSPDGLVSTAAEVEVLVVTFTAVIGVKVPVYKCNRCALPPPSSPAWYKSCLVISA
jgi:hypothetical protein